ncbi:SIR2 family protein [Methylophilus sp. Leaf408]|uniref:SIR2 family protein n=1 Tax=Methylophilus sp. Leaf408 TaxID=2876561 RepID=UPI001E2F41E6|nr:SIR2 family protein [Methylophilus sp. Leaf408]
MALAPVYDANTITVRATLELLDGPFAEMAKGVSEDIYTLWLGSGISYGRVPGLQTVIKNLLKFLQERVVKGDANCRFRIALTEIIGYTHPTAQEIERNNLDQPIENWPDLEPFSQRLVTNYARMLDVLVDQEAADFLVWAGIDVASTYANPSTRPDAEHLCLALLVSEGVASSIASANWDDLVEKAVSELSNGTALSVVVRPEDLRGNQQRTHLYKFHGCALKASQDEANYRVRLVARKSQIDAWTAVPENRVILNQLVLLATTKRTLMIGLSAQDSNIQGVFAQAETSMPWPWPSTDLAYVFSANSLNPDHAGLLKNVYRENYSVENRSAINEEALIKAYGKPLLTALVLNVLCLKLSALASTCPGAIDPAGRSEIEKGIFVVRDTLSQVVEGLGHEPFIRELIAQSERVLSLFHKGKAPAQESHFYYPLSTDPVNITVNHPHIGMSGLRELGVAVGLIGMGLSENNWNLKPSDRTDPKSGALGIVTKTHSANLFFAANVHAALCLHNNEHVTTGDNAVIVHSLDIPPAMSRSPRGAPGRTGRATLREVSINELMEESTNVTSLFERFREETAL